MMRPLKKDPGRAGPVWVQCTLADSGEPVHVNMAYAATFVARDSGARIWMAEERRTIDVMETPAEIAEAMSATRPTAGRAPAPHPFAFPLARQETSRH